ncbi:MAG: hypothetical protein ABW061_13105, partial [Polyangiaceae bacterium]
HSRALGTLHFGARSDATQPFEVPMRSATNYLLSVGLLGLGTLALTSSCADNNSSLFVIGVIDTNSTSCVAKADTTVGFLANGTMDVLFTSSYTASVLVGNQLTQRGSREQLRTETSRISLRGAEVTLTTLDGRDLGIGIGSYSTVGTGFVDASAGDVPSYASMAVNVIPPLSRDRIDALLSATSVVLAKIRVFGDTLGNVSITSSELDFPINICEGCLVRYPADAADPLQGANMPYKCTTAASTTQTTDVAPCVLGQDAAFSCTFCSAAYDECRDPKLNKSYTPATP